MKTQMEVKKMQAIFCFMANHKAPEDEKTEVIFENIHQACDELLHDSHSH